MSNLVKPVKILKASAGSGKTHALTSYYLNLLFSSKGDTKFKDILAVTFTNKATEEMKSRILSELRNLAKKQGDPVISENILKTFPHYTPGTLREKATHLYRRILHDYSRFSILTIDSFVQKVIRGFAFELGLEPGFKVEINSYKVQKALVKQLDQALDSNPILLEYCLKLVIKRLEENKAWDYQRELSSLADHLFKEEYAEHENAITILLKDRNIDQIFEEYNTLSHSLTHSFEKKMDAYLFEVTQIYTPLEIPVQEHKLQSRSPLFNIKKNFKDGFNKEKVEPLLKLVDNPDKWLKGKDIWGLYDLLNPLLSSMKIYYLENSGKYLLAKSVTQNLSLLRLLHELNGLLKVYREESGELLISDTQKLLSGITGPDTGTPSFIWEKLGNKYRNFLLDEFQDTSKMQWNNFEPLMLDSIASHRGDKIDNLLVGDVKQSIYRWRNGDWRLLHQEAEKGLKSINVENGSLDYNFRSHKSLIEFNNKLFQVIPSLLQSELNSLVTENGDLGANNDWWRAKGYDTDIIDIYKDSVQKPPHTSKIGGSVHIEVFYDLKSSESAHEDEPSFDSQSENQENNPESSIQEKLIEKSVLEIHRLIHQENYIYSDICILVKTNSEVKIALNSLLSNNLPVVSGEALIIGKHKAIELLLYSFRFLVAPAINANLYLANCLVIFADLEGLPFPQSEIMGLEESSMELTQDKSIQDKLPHDFLHRKDTWLSLPVSEIFERLIETYHLDQSKSNIPYLLGFRDLISTFSTSGEEGISRFLFWWKEEGYLKGLPSGNSPNAVQVSTIHKAKGLAYRAVLIPFCNWKLSGFFQKEVWFQTSGTDYHGLKSIPIRFIKDLVKTPMATQYFLELLNSYLDATNELYVALTRAREHIYISLPGKKSEKEAKKSKFIDIGDYLNRALKELQIPSVERGENRFYFWPPVEKEKIQKTTILRAHLKGSAIENISLYPYPLSARMSLPNEESTLDNKNRFKGNAFSRRGAILHEILSKVKEVDTLDSVMLTLRNQGLFLRSDGKDLKEEVIKILAHPELQQLFKNAKQVYNERDILLNDLSVRPDDKEVPNHESTKSDHRYRPDKVLFSETETIILDYKFTQSERTSHIAQVKKYAELLVSMGYPNTRTFLFYGLTHTLKEV